MRRIWILVGVCCLPLVASAQGQSKGVSMQSCFESVGLMLDLSRQLEDFSSVANVQAKNVSEIAPDDAERIIKGVSEYRLLHDRLMADVMALCLKLPI
jgi:hypothetical protein